MYAHSSPHPTAETLEAYGAGKLDDVLAEAVAGHLEDCPECRRRVAEMAPDTFLGRLRDAGVRPEAIASDRRSTPHGPAMEPGRTVADPRRGHGPVRARSGSRGPADRRSRVATVRPAIGVWSL